MNSINSTDSSDSTGSTGSTENTGSTASKDLPGSSGSTGGTGGPSGSGPFHLSERAPNSTPPLRPRGPVAPSTPPLHAPQPPEPAAPHRTEQPAGPGQPQPPSTPPVAAHPTEPPSLPRPRAPWEPPLPESHPPPPVHPPVPAMEPPPAEPPQPPAPQPPQAPPRTPPSDAPQRPAVPPAFARPPGPGATGPSRPRTGYVGDRPPTYDPEPTTLPVATPEGLGQLIADTVLDGARYGSYTLRAASVRGDSARYRGEARRDALLTARFGTGMAALVLVAVASGARGVDGSYRAASDACRWIGGAVGRSHARLSEDIRAGRRGALKSGLHRLTDRSMGKLRATALEAGAEPDEYTVGLRCLLLSADPECRTRVYFGVGPGGLFRLREGVWQDIEPVLPGPEATVGGPVLGYGSTVPARSQGQAPSADEPSETPSGDRLTMDLGIPTPPAPFVEAPPPPPAEPFRFRASVARPGDTLLLCSPGFAEPLRSEPACSGELASRWAAPAEPPGLAAFLADVQIRVKGYADDRTAIAVWET
ncbi:protein phosphatase 2C domain-containing protein [Streptomyces albipurpureus]|uniref:Protein phosphatase 2C domain-containing protein n=1 Tax=Streptomyces albipurpureus TaxID=2897419 RepID=A0ABT0UFR8_9ACTN|nr:protein phosphatase 2C domain-containing protein [Streptomyces sp. CWNU-1]MCM2386976.1 protein phosphatase 2C domain-containing protein [Streptomyces sp. CWNU-1]